MANEAHNGDDATVRSDGAARWVLAVRQMMRDTITADLVLNPASDMLFALYLRRHEGGSISPEQVCATTGAATEVCRRWGLALEERGLVAIDEEGYRLTQSGETTMARINEQIWQLAATHIYPGDATAEAD